MIDKVASYTRRIFIRYPEYPQQLTFNMDTDTLCVPPEVCGPDAELSKSQHLLSQTTNDNDSRVAKFVKRDKPLLVAIAAMVILMNIPHLSNVLYPFKIFSTWIHEMCHGIAAILVGGGIQKILVYPDTSGLAYTYTDGSNFKRGFVASGGYTGTAVLVRYPQSKQGITI